MHKAATVISIIIYDTFTSEYLGMLFTHSDWLTQRCPAKYYMYNSFWIEFRAQKKLNSSLPSGQAALNNCYLPWVNLSLL